MLVTNNKNGTVGIWHISAQIFRITFLSNLHYRVKCMYTSRTVYMSFCVIGLLFCVQEFAFECGGMSWNVVSMTLFLGDDPICSE